MLGELFNPQPQTAEPNPELKSQWDGWLQNPANRAGLLSFGLQAMMGGWGSGTQQLAGALGAGVEGYAGAEKLRLDEEKAAMLRGESSAEKEEERELRRELNTADNEAAMARTQADITGRKDLLNTRLAGGMTGYSKGAQDMYKQAYLKVLGGAFDPGDPNVTEKALAAATAAAEKHEAMFPREATSGKTGNKGGPPPTPSPDDVAATGERNQATTKDASKDIASFPTDSSMHQLWKNNRAQMILRGYKNSGEKQDASPQGGFEKFNKARTITNSFGTWTLGSDGQWQLTKAK